MKLDIDCPACDRYTPEVIEHETAYDGSEHETKCKWCDALIIWEVAHTVDAHTIEVSE